MMQRFDCVECKQSVQEEIYEQIKDRSVEGEITHFEEAAAGGPFGTLWKKLTKPDGKGAPRQRP